MKRMMMLSSILLVFIFATACSNGNNNDLTEPINPDNTADMENEGNANGNNESNNGTMNESNENTETNTGVDNNSDNGRDEAKNQDDMKEMLQQLDFYEFELEVSYGNDKEFEIQIEHHSNGDVEAEVEDELNDKNINDDLDAFNYIYPNAKKLNVSQDMDKQDAIDQILQAFDLPDDYEKIEIEFEFEDGAKLEFEDKR